MHQTNLMHFDDQLNVRRSIGTQKNLLVFLVGLTLSANSIKKVLTLLICDTFCHNSHSPSLSLNYYKSSLNTGGIAN